jgi:hypothetical protein
MKSGSIYYLFYFLLYISFHVTQAAKQPPTEEIDPNVHQCIHYNNKIMKLATLQNPPVICLQCDPTTPFCDPLCQKALDYQFASCRGVCLPDGFYYDVCKFIFSLSKS